MDNNYTELEMIKFLYNEMDNEERDELKEKLKSDISLQTKMASFKLAKMVLNQVNFSPSETSIQLIMDAVSEREEMA